MSSGVSRGHGLRARDWRRGLGAAVALLAAAVLSACGDDAATPPGFMIPDMDAADRPMDAGSDAAREEDARVVPPPPRDAGSDARVALDAAPPPDPDEDADVPDCGDLDCAALSDECSLGVCDPETVTCHLEPRADGTFCGSAATEDCSARDTCQQGACVPNHAPAGTPCDDQNVDCHRNDECDGQGQCVDNGLMPERTPCGDQTTNNDCNDPDTCDDQGVCQPNYAPVDSLCGDVGVLCRYDDRCDGQGECVDSGIWMLDQCPTMQVSKDGQQYCLCGRNARDTCHPGPDVCIDGTCRLGHEQFAPDGITTDGMPCGNGDPIDAECDNPDECDRGQCEQNGKPEGLPCGNQAVNDPICDQPDACNGYGTCDPRWALMTTVCGAQPGECWQEPLCDGLGSCAPAEPAPPVTSCGDPLDDDCTDPDTCDGAGGCDPNDTSC